MHSEEWGLGENVGRYLEERVSFFLALLVDALLVEKHTALFLISNVYLLPSS